MTASPSRCSRGVAAGFSLVEIMIAVLLGLVSTIAITQVFLGSEGQKRTITGVGDAQTNGALALYSIQRDVRGSGYGAAAYQLLGCDLTLRSGVTLQDAAPVVINAPTIPQGDANTDTILVASGDGNGSPDGYRILTPSTSSPLYRVQTPTSFAVSDRIIAMPEVRPSPCGLSLSTVLAISGNLLTVSDWATGIAKGTVYNLGRAPTVLVYAVRGGNLTVCDYIANDCGDASLSGDRAVWVPIANGIVSLRAQYGRDTTAPMDGVSDLYDQMVASPTTTPPVSSLQCGWARISALRFAIVARSAQYERNEVTSAAPNWSGASSTPINLSTDADWRHYRYKVFETVVPIRNILWLGAQSGC